MSDVLFSYTDNQEKDVRKAFLELPSHEREMLEYVFLNQKRFTPEKELEELRTKALKKSDLFLKSHPDGKIWFVQNNNEIDFLSAVEEDVNAVIVWCMSPLLFSLFMGDAELAAKLFQSDRYSISLENLKAGKYKTGRNGEGMYLCERSHVTDFTEFFLVPYFKNKTFPRVLTYKLLKEYSFFFESGSGWFSVYGNNGRSFFPMFLDTTNLDYNERMLDLMEFIAGNDMDFFQEIVTPAIFTDLVLGTAFKFRSKFWSDAVAEEEEKEKKKEVRLKKLYQKVKFDSLPEDVFWHRYLVMKGLEKDPHFPKGNYLVEDVIFFDDNKKVKQQWEYITGRKLVLDFRRIDPESIMKNAADRDSLDFWEKNCFNPDTGEISGDFFTQLMELTEYVYYPENIKRCSKPLFDREYLLENCSEEQILAALKKNFFRDCEAGDLITMAQKKGITAVLPALILMECGELKGGRNGKKSVQKRADA